MMLMFEIDVPKIMQRLGVHINITDSGVFL